MFRLIRRQTWNDSRGNPSASSLEDAREDFANQVNSNRFSRLKEKVYGRQNRWGQDRAPERRLGGANTSVCVRPPERAAKRARSHAILKEEEKEEEEGQEKEWRR